MRAAERIEGSILLIKSCLARRIDSSCSLSFRQGFTRPIVAVSQLWWCCGNLGGDGGINVVRPSAEDAGRVTGVGRHPSQKRYVYRLAGGELALS